MFSDSEKILKFINTLPPVDGLTLREIAGGTELPIGEVRRLLDDLTAAGDVRVVDASVEFNLRRYCGLSAPVIAPSVQTEWVSAADQWAIAAREHGLADWRRRHPEESEQQKRYEPSDEEIAAEAAAKKTVTPITPEERRELELSTRNRTPRNPQQHLVK